MAIRVEQAESDTLWVWVQPDSPDDPHAKYRVRSVIPVEPGVIVKIFHVINERPGVPADGRTWNDVPREPSSDSALEKVLAKSTHVYSSPGSDEELGPRVRWKDLVESQGLVWHSEVNATTISEAFGGSWPARVWGPEEGNLDEEQLVALLRILLESGVTRSAIASHPCWRCEPMENWQWRFDLEEFLDVRHHRLNTFGEGPSHVMATDGSWFLEQDIDLPFTLLSAPEAVVERVLADPVLEAVVVSTEDRVDNKADAINAGGPLGSDPT